jgi:hypothetical protein
MSDGPADSEMQDGEEVDPGEPIAVLTTTRQPIC